jgi:hypothetical protein
VVRPHSTEMGKTSEPPAMYLLAHTTVNKWAATLFSFLRLNLAGFFVKHLTVVYPEKHTSRGCHGLTITDQNLE